MDEGVRSEVRSGARHDRAVLLVTWDFDSAQGQVGATYPYYFRRLPLEQELDAVGQLLALGTRLGTPMTYATVGFAAEDVPEPFDAHGVIAELHRAGNEIASHSWRHEWFPHLSTQQVRRSLLRSKAVLDRAAGEVGAVRGFVPPFNRPMTWPRHLQFHPGDRWAVPTGAVTTGSLLRAATGAGYEWVRVSYRPNVSRRADPLPQPRMEGGCMAVGHHHNGFTERAHALLDLAVERRCVVVLSGHPAGLFRRGNEQSSAVVALLERAATLRDQGRLEIATVSDALLAPRVTAP